jgi:hypothetical protein
MKKRKKETLLLGGKFYNNLRDIQKVSKALMK